MRKGILFVTLGTLLWTTLACAGPTPPPTPLSPTEPPPSNPPPTATVETAILELINESNATVCSVQISPVADETWGEDWLEEGEVITPGASRRFEVPTGSYDLRALSCDEYALDARRAVVITGLLPWSLTDSAQATLTLINNSSTTVCDVLISLSHSDTWGDDWLNEDAVLTPGDACIFHMPVGIYDLAALDCEQNFVAEEYTVEIAGALEWTLAQSVAETIRLTLVNYTAETICRVYITPTDSEAWGDDWLGSAMIGPGETHTLQVPVGSYDLQARGCNGDVLSEKRGVDLTASQEWALSP